MAKKYYGGEDAVQVKKVYGKAMASKMKSAENNDMNRDSGMIREDWSAPCLLPRQVIDRDWPRSEVYMKEGAADLFMGVQKQLNEDKSDMRKASSEGPHKY